MKLKKIGIMTIGSMATVAIPVFAISCGSGTSSGSGRGQNPGGINPLDDPNYDASDVAQVKLALDQDEDLINAVRDTYYVEDHGQEFLVHPGTPNSISGQYDALLSRMQPLINQYHTLPQQGNGVGVVNKETYLSFNSTLKQFKLMEYKTLRGNNQYNLRTTWGEIDSFDPNIKSLNTHAANVHFVFKDGKWQARYQLMPFTEYTPDNKYLFLASLPFDHSITDARQRELENMPGGSSSPDFNQFNHTYFDKYVPLKPALSTSTNPWYYFIDPNFPLYNPDILYSDADIAKAYPGYPDAIMNDHINREIYEASWNYVPLDEVESTSELGIAWQATKEKYGI